MEEQMEKETIGTKIKKFVIRNKKKFIVGGGVLGGVLLGGGILKRHMQDDSYIETIDEDYESVEYVEDSDESNEDSSEE